MLDAKIRAVRRKLRSVGLLATLKIVVDRLRRILLSREELLFYVNPDQYEMKPEQIAPQVRYAAYEQLEKVPKQDLAAIEEYTGAPYLDEGRRRLGNGWTLFLANIDGTVCGGGWGITNQTEFRTKVVPLLDGDVALIDYFTLPDFRGRGVYTSLLCHCVRHYREQGKSRLYCSANKDNMPAIKALRAANFHYVSNYECFALGRTEFVIWKRARVQGVGEGGPGPAGTEG